jgi:pimeloyl-ACP methyl ester carboxylesterase
MPTLPGIEARTIETDRIETRVLFSGPEHAVPVLFLHGNVSSATWWEDVMLALPVGFRGIAPDQRGFGEADPDKKIDAKLGMGDLADDAVALLDHLDVDRCHVVGHSLGGSVVWQLLRDCPHRFLTVTQVAPGSPYGFGGTKDLVGTPCYDDYAGSGGGLSNPELLKRLGERDDSLESPFSPRAVFRTLVVKPPFVPEREDALIASMLTIHLGDKDNPGGFTPSPNWPYVAPGVWGAANALSPRYAGSVDDLVAAEPKAPILWLRGSHDVAVSNNAASDPATVGAAGFLPGWPGLEVYPPQPMVDQTRAVLERYAAAGGQFTEVVLAETGHTPFIEKPEAFNRQFHAHIQ